MGDAKICQALSQFRNLEHLQIHKGELKEKSVDFILSNLIKMHSFELNDVQISRKLLDQITNSLVVYKELKKPLLVAKVTSEIEMPEQVLAESPSPAKRRKEEDEVSEPGEREIEYVYPLKELKLSALKMSR